MVQTRKRERELVKLRSLRNDPENRNILSIVETPTGQVTVYEPSKEDIQEIMLLDDMVAAFNQESESNNLDISGATILKELIPRLTDLEIDQDMSDEEMSQIIENPTVELMEIQNILSSVVTNIYSDMFLKFKNELELKQMVDLTENISDKTLGMFIEKASKTDDGRQSILEISKKSKEIKADQSGDEDLEKDATVLDPKSHENEIKQTLEDHFSPDI